MFEKISNGWELMKSSARVLREDTSLLLFPVVSGIACLIVVASFALPLFLTGAYRIDENAQQVTHNPIAYAVLLLFYFCNYFVIIFFNSALVACAIIRFKGGTPSLNDGFQAAVARLPQILAWSLVSAFVGFALKMLESRSEKVGAIVSGLLGLAWSIATFFVVPVIVIEKAGPFEAVQRSMSILRRAWGEAFVGNQGIGFLVFIAAIVACARPRWGSRSTAALRLRSGSPSRLFSRLVWPSSRPRCTRSCSARFTFTPPKDESPTLSTAPCSRRRSHDGTEGIASGDSGENAGYQSCRPQVACSIRPFDRPHQQSRRNL